MLVYIGRGGGAGTMVVTVVIPNEEFDVERLSDYLLKNTDVERVKTKKLVKSYGAFTPEVGEDAISWDVFYAPADPKSFDKPVPRHITIRLSVPVYNIGVLGTLATRLLPPELLPTFRAELKKAGINI